MLLGFTKKNALTSLIVILFLATFLMTSCSNNPKDNPIIVEVTPAPTSLPKAMPPNFQEFSRVDELMIAQNDDGMEGVIDKNGWVVEPKYISVRDYSEGLAAVAISHDTEADLLKQQGYNDKEMKDTLLAKGIHKSLIYNMIEKARDKKYADLWGFVDIYGNTMIHPKYKSAGRFKSGLALVEEYVKKWEKNLYYYIDQTGSRVIPLEWDDFEQADEFQDDGTAIIKRQCGVGVIDIAGNIVIPFIFSELTYAVDGYRAAKSLESENNDLWGLINEVGNWIVEPKFNDVQITTDGHLLVNYVNEEEQISGNGIINVAGDWIMWPRELDVITSDYDMLICSERKAGDFIVPKVGLYNYGGERLLGDRQYQDIEIVNKDVIKGVRYTYEQGENGAYYQYVRPDGKLLINGLSDRKIGFLGNFIKSKIGVFGSKRIEFAYIYRYDIEGKIELDDNSKLGILLDNTALEYYKVEKPLDIVGRETISIYEGDTCIMTITDGDYYFTINFGDNEQYLSQKPKDFDSFEFFKLAFKE